MQNNSVWGRACGLTRTVVEGVRFDETSNAIVVSVRPNARARSRCGRCGRRSPGYDRGAGRRRWRGLDAGTTRVFIEADAPRIRCRVHGPTVAQVPWARHDVGHTRDFDAMAERIEGLVESQHQLLRDVSHELRSPLARLEVALGLAHGSSGKELETNLDRIGLESERLNTLIGELLTLARIEGDTLGFERRHVDLAGLLREVVDDAGFEAQAMGSSVVLGVLQQCSIEGSSSLLRSAVDNVLRNAVRFTSPESEVEVNLRVEEGEIFMTVCDRGPGVPEEQLQRIFEPFARVGDARDRISGGRGLGLAIAERAVRLHGGSVSAKNRPGGGLEVILRFLRS